MILSMRLENFGDAIARLHISVNSSRDIVRRALHERLTKKSCLG